MAIMFMLRAGWEREDGPRGYFEPLFYALECGTAVHGWRYVDAHVGDVD